MSGWTREVLRRVPVVDRDTAREYVDGIVKQSPQGEPHGAVNAGAAAVDALAGAGVRSYPGNAFVVGGRAPYKAWVQRGGKARFELLMMDATREEKKRLSADEPSIWAVQRTHKP